MTLTGAGKVAGVIGWPIGHSKSPQLHHYWIDRHKVDGVVVPLEVAPENLESALKALPKLGLAGVSVTIPHKETCLAFLDEVSPLVLAVGACNMIAVQDGKLIGDNTDVFGFSENLRLGAPKADFDRLALVLGAGGAARAVVAGLAQLGVKKVVIANRTEDRAKRIAADMAQPLGISIEVIPWQQLGDALAEAGVLVNATSLGMVGQPALDIDLGQLPSSCVVTDIVYQPLETDLLKNAKSKGCATVDGLGMLLHQGRPAFQAWFGIDPHVTDDQRALVLSLK